MGKKSRGYIKQPKFVSDSPKTTASVSVITTVLIKICTLKPFPYLYRWIIELSGKKPVFDDNSIYQIF